MRALTWGLLLMGAVLAQSVQDPWVLYRAPRESKPGESQPAPPPPPSAPLPTPGLPSLPGMPSFPSPVPAQEGTGQPLPGTLMKGKLLTGVYLVPGKTVPVAVELEDGAVLVGRARFDPTGRVWIDLDTMVKEKQVFSVNAVALEATEATQGLPARVGEEAPTLLADLVRGSLGGISDFVKATLEATTVVPLPGGGQAVQKTVPSLELFLLARAANLVALPQDQTAVIRTVKVDRGTTLYVLFLPGADQGNGLQTPASPGR